MSGQQPRAELGFGGASLGNMFEAIDDRTADETLVAAWDAGARHFDTAPVYGNGLGELRFGHFLRRCPRDDYKISTKVGRLVKAPFTAVRTSVGSATGPGVGETSIFEDSLPFRVDVDYGYDAAMRSVEDSMARLGLTYLTSPTCTTSDRTISARTGRPSSPSPRPAPSGPCGNCDSRR